MNMSEAIGADQTVLLCSKSGTWQLGQMATPDRTG